MSSFYSTTKHLPITKTLSKLIDSENKIEIQTRHREYQININDRRKLKKGVAYCLNYIETTMHNKPINFAHKTYMYDIIISYMRVKTG